MAFRNWAIQIVILFVALPSYSFKQQILEAYEPLLASNQPADRRYPCLFVGVVTPVSTMFMALGQLDGSGRAPDENTIFEIGSVTKALLGLLLANASLDQKVDLDRAYEDQVDLTLPNYKEQKITWRHLATHSAGFPRIPGNLTPADPMQPYFDYDLRKLTTFLDVFILPVAPGTASGYSNIGAGIVGYGLERIYRKPLEQIFVENLFDDLGMKDTRIHLSDEQRRRLAPPNLNGRPSQTWRWNEGSVLQGAGALKSTMRDMVTLLKTMMGDANQELAPVVELATNPTFDIDHSNQVGLFWNHVRGTNVVWHNGGTYGAKSFIGYSRDKGVGVIAFTNTQIVDEISGSVDQRFDYASLDLITAISEQIDEEKMYLVRDRFTSAK